MIEASSWRSEPAAELRGLAKTLSPAAAWRALISAKSACREIDLAADLATSGIPLPRSFFGMSPTVQRIRGDVLADRAVAAGRGGDELALLIAQAQRQAVDLRLGREDERRLRAEREEAPDAFDELAHVSSPKPLASDSIGTRWRTLANFSEAFAPTFWVRLADVRSSGKRASSAS